MLVQKLLASGTVPSMPYHVCIMGTVWSSVGMYLTEEEDKTMTPLR